MRQAAAILIDAYRELNARRMFWVAVVISLLIVGCFLAIGITERGIQILWFEVPAFINTDLIPASTFYKFMFVQFGINVWLTWGAAILALTSTSGLIPELIRSGAIEMVLSRPISRPKLFLLKYLAGLLFVVLQVLVFTTASFIVIGIRGQSWEWGLFLAVPIVVLFFSYLFSIQVLLGMVTRSSTASLLLTLIAWMLISGVHVAESAVLAVRINQEGRIATLDKDLQIREADIAAYTRAPDADASVLARKQDALEAQRKTRSEAGDTFTLTRRWHEALYNTKTLLPKLAETTTLLNKHLMSEDEITRLLNMQQQRATAGPRGRDRADRVQSEFAATREQANRPLWWILGTSIGFEAVVLLIAGWLFCRRDF